MERKSFFRQVVETFAAWARGEFILLAPATKGATISKRKELETVLKTKSDHPSLKMMKDDAKKQLEAHGECPHQLVYIWLAFLELGLDFSWTDLHAWSKLTKRKLDHWEIKLLARLSVIRNQVNGR